MKSLNKIALLLLVSFVSCTNVDIVHQVYEKAGENRTELETVTTYFAKHPDPKKAEAAQFVVLNMENKWSVMPRDSSAWSLLLDTIAGYSDPCGWDPYLSTINKDLQSITDSLRIKKHVRMDVKIQKSEYLINDIKNAFKKWETTPWREKYSFEDFCRWVLPYKIGSERPEDWRTAALEMKITNEDSITRTGDVYRLAVLLINNTGIYYNIGMSRFPMPMTYCDMSRVKRGDCAQMANYALMLFRSRGIPSAIDCTPVWANRSSGHVWNAVILPNGKSKDINYHPEGKNSFAYKVSKIYRKSYEILRGENIYKHRKTESAPPFFSDFNMLDVTNQYDMPLSTVKIDNLKKSDSRLVWLCTFDNHKWVPVAYTEKCWGKATFENVARGKLPEGSDPLQYINAGGGIAYLPAYYIDNEVKPASEPFILYENGNVKKLTPDTINTQALVIGRKYPKHPHFDQYEKDMIGGRFEVANRTDFKDAKTIFTITRQQKYPMERFDLAASPGKYRYVRYITRDSIVGNVAEMKFYSEDGVCNGLPIGVKGDTPERGPKALFDDNMESFYYSSKNTFPVWAGLDLGKRESITGLAFAARTDDNEVRLGDTYQLYYWVNGWREADKTVADSYTLRWSGIPRNTIYLLKNLSRGVEHRPFTYENGVQVWW